jgi:hypothetical protein
MRSLIRIAVALERIATALEANVLLIQNKPIIIKTDAPAAASPRSIGIFPTMKSNRCSPPF